MAKLMSGFFFFFNYKDYGLSEHRTFSLNLRILDCSLQDGYLDNGEI